MRTLRDVGKELGKGKGAYVQNSSVSPLIYSLLSRPYIPKLKVPRKVMMGLTSLTLVKS